MTTKLENRNFVLRLARSERDLRAAQRLRYKVFVEELGAAGNGVDTEHRLETDRFDSWFDHLLLIDRRRDEENLEHVVGVYRLLRDEVASQCGGYYSDSEFDLSVLKNSGKRLLELGRSCVHRDYRESAAIYLLWNGLADYVLSHRIEIMFGVASFHGLDLSQFRHSMAYLHHRHLAPEDRRVRVPEAHYQSLNLMPLEEVDRRVALAAIPALIHGYMRMGAFVGDGAYIDREFNTIDVCVIVDIERMSARHRGFYTRNRGSR